MRVTVAQVDVSVDARVVALLFLTAALLHSAMRVFVCNELFAGERYYCDASNAASQRSQTITASSTDAHLNQSVAPKKNEKATSIGLLYLCGAVNTPRQLERRVPVRGPCGC